MNLSQLLQNPESRITIAVDGLALNNFAIKVAETTAQNIVKELHQPDTPISEADACRIYKRTRQTFSKYRKTGKIRHHFILGGIVYFQKELEEDFKKL